ncbi:MAG TPA: discoidin domain-containing protein [Chryseolinea sp.]
MKKVKANLLIFLMLFSFALKAQIGVLTQHNDLNRTGWNAQETILHTKNIKPGSFGKLFVRAVDDQIYAQPLVMLNVNMPVVGKKNIVFVATVNNTVYAFDADSAKVATPYWKVNLSPAGSRAIKNTDMTGACGGGYRDFSGNMGIVGTPVIDPSTNTLYVVARSLNTTTNTFQQHLHALDILTGQEKPNSPKLITAQVNGHGSGNVNGVVSFNPQKQNQRSGLLLLNGIVYIAYASHCDWGPYHGWILGYDKSSMAQKIVYNTTPEGYNGGIWMSGAAPAADELGNIYASVGNGSVGVTNNPSDLTNRSESALKLIPSGSTLTVSTFFTPKNIAELEATDLDFGVTAVLLIPNTNRALTACKDGRIYLLDRNNMGGYSATTNNVIQTIDLGATAHLRSSLGYYKGQQKEFVYSWSENSLLKAYPFNRNTNMFDLNNTINSGVQGPTGNNGAVLSVSSNGSVDSTAILWASYAANGDANQSVRPGILRALMATDVTKELWNSSQYSTDVPGNYAKFNCPTVVNGKVYLATFSNQLVVYGMTGNVQADQCNSQNIGLSKTAAASSAENVNHPASAAFDGNIATRWSSLATDPQWLSVDLGERYDLCNVILRWEAAVGKDFKIQVSDDATTWKDLISRTNNTALENYLPVTGTGRYVRLYGTARGTQWGYSLWEFEVFGKKHVSCATPTALSVTDISENAASLHWQATGATKFNVQYKTVSAGSWTTTSSATNALTLTGLACATDYLFQIQSVCDATHSSNYSASTSLSTSTCTSPCSPLPTRWTTLDIGEVGVSGSACYNDGVFELQGSGDDIGNTQDAFRFAFKTLVGGGEITARITSLDQANAWNKCGIMFRESLTPGSRYAFIALTSGNGVTFQNRIVTDGVSNDENTVAGINAPVWVKLVKNGSVYTAYHSADGIGWIKVGNSIDAGFGVDVPVYAGLALTSHDNAVLSNALVDNYLLSGILDIELQSFTASATLAKTVALEWITTLETNINNFVVERSDNMLNFTDLDTVAAVNNGRFTNTYTHEDSAPLQTLSYYRLRITDNDGVTSYSAPVSISLITSTQSVLEEIPPTVYANPSQEGVIHIKQGNNRIKSIALYDNTGRLMVLRDAITSDMTDIPVHTFANGLYTLEIKTSKLEYRQKIMIRN